VSDCWWALFGVRIESDVCAAGVRSVADVSEYEGRTGILQMRSALHRNGTSISGTSEGEGDGNGTAQFWQHKAVGGSGENRFTFLIRMTTSG
jgi:hypothetical protein